MKKGIYTIDTQYYLNINSLRAIAALLIFFFHLDINLVSGGYVGVDIFFVVSGYVISMSFFKLKKNKNFFLIFFAKRILRIVPSIVILSIILLIVCKIIFLDNHFFELFNSIVPSNLFYSNFYFWNQFGYFGIENSFKPLLHTWSLSVEAQLYLALPVLILCLLNYKNLTIFLIVLLSLLSVLFAEIYISRPFVYFFPFFRLHEFLIGILLFYYIHIFKGKKFNQNFFYIGLILIIFCAIKFNKNTDFPGINSLLPVIGTSIIILSKEGSILSYNKIVNFFGNTSYSLYLYHWPIIILYKYLFLKTSLNFVDNLSIFIIVSFVSFFTYKFIELRFKKLEKKSFKILILLFISLIIVSFIVFFNFKKNNTQVFKNFYERNLKFRNETGKLIQERAFDINKKNIFFIGDSHAVDLIMSLEIKKNNIVNNNILINLSADCLMKVKDKSDRTANIEDYLKKFIKYGNFHCEEQLKYFYKNKIYFQNSNIILAFRWSAESSKKIKDLIKIINDNNNLIIFGRRPSFYDIPSIVEIKEFNYEELNKISYYLQNLQVKKINSLLFKTAQNNNVKFLDLYQTICFDEKKKCIIVNNKNILFLDNDHFSIDGMKFFQGKIEEIINKNIR